MTERERSTAAGSAFTDRSRECSSAIPRVSGRRRPASAGWVRNCADGSVEAVLEGDPAAVEQMLEFCRGGPPSAEVRRVEVAEETPEGLRRFEVR